MHVLHTGKFPIKKSAQFLGGYPRGNLAEYLNHRYLTRLETGAIAVQSHAVFY